LSGGQIQEAPSKIQQGNRHKLKTARQQYLEQARYHLQFYSNLSENTFLK
jgi:hypothetical protein